MQNHDPSFPEASSETLMAFFSKRAGRRLFTVRYLLDFKCSNWKVDQNNGSKLLQLILWTLVTDVWDIATVHELTRLIFSFTLDKNVVKIRSFLIFIFDLYDFKLRWIFLLVCFDRNFEDWTYAWARGAPAALRWELLCFDEKFTRPIPDFHLAHKQIILTLNKGQHFIHLI